MHGKQFLLDSVHAGIDEAYVYGRLDFKGQIPEMQFEIVVNLESWAAHELAPRKVLRMDVVIKERKVVEWKLSAPDQTGCLQPTGEEGAKVALVRNFEFRVPLIGLAAGPAGEKERQAGNAQANRIRLRLSLWQNRLPVDVLPLEGWIELYLLEEGELMSMY